jgi:hypothetical protein
MDLLANPLGAFIPCRLNSYGCLAMPMIMLEKDYQVAE